ncbi:MAG: MBOAT family protein [Turicibacter sp.]|uniref:Alginate O-acetylation protein n=1 Tax=Turicibacter faecis TaxID=2963365 RepID=A0ABN6ZDZ1_9FIRM|nr:MULTISPECIES: MBOAT family protein [unclassified Turicibacter]MCI8700682.1 MBOAT family protein [Turicibacter sp.]BEH90160.1 alginate O-acetylation protein [Turicibacter sp. TC023]MCU7204678.1 MBOAT family protein [Turicibacter sp. TA25]MCU7208543.1 MBOAT family protein [Turicibacter sp. 1E2]NCE78345.1 MBOAT family protein [Turicibacter sp. TS3]
MVFSSLVFLFVFLPLTLLLYFSVPRRLRNTILLIVSLIFYAWGEPIYIILMLFSTVTDFVHGLLVERYRNQPKKAKLVVLSSITINLGLLVFFKYSTFLLTNINLLFHTNFYIPQMSLPIGISFYTFQTMSYTIDVFRQEAKAKKNMIDLGAYVTMFPQLIAGPIVRYQTIANQLDHRVESEDLFAKGIWRFTIGLGKKVLLANNIGLLWNQIQLTEMSDLSIVMAWLGLVAFGFQIYFDFSGYSDMAIGLGYLFGFELLENFNYPYISQSITEFWRRWHISLGSWFRDYVYIPLGGNRKGKKRMYLNLFIVWMLTGLWHGASWNFVLWGLYFGILIIIEKAFLLFWLSRAPRWMRHVYTIILLLIGWGLFAFEDFHQLINYFTVLFGLRNATWVNQETLYYLSQNIILFVLLTIASTPMIRLIGQKLFNSPYGSVIKAFIVPMICLLILIASTAYLVDSSYNPFLYFRF